MPFSSEYLLKHSDSETSPILKRTFIRNIDDGEYNSAKYYRNIPVTKTFGDLKAPGFYCENVSGIKGMKNSDGRLSVKAYHTGTSSLFGPKLFTGTTKKSLKLEVDKIQRQLYPYHSLPNRIKKRSVSEPDLTVVKVPEEKVSLRGLYRGDTCLESQYFANEIPAPLKTSGVGGSVYIINAGKVFKSKIEAENLCLEENDLFRTTNRENLCKFPQLENITSKSSDCATWLGTNTLKSANREGGDFEIAIFLSGLNNGSGVKPQMQDVQHPRTKGKGIRKAKKKKTEARKSETSKINPYVPDASLRFYRKPDESDVQSEELPSRGSGIPNTCENSKHSESRQMKGKEASCKSVTSSKNISKHKKSDSELWAKFETTFRSYASSDRHSGEVIPKKMSTVWMKDASVVGDIMTEKEATEAFRQAAGAKITMNTKEYKEFLVMLSRRRKLPYYEIYHRMCGMQKERKTLP